MKDTWNEKDLQIMEEEQAQREAEQPTPPLAAASVAAFAANDETLEDPKEFLEAPFAYQMSGSESVSLNSGTLQYTHTDFVLPGKDGFDLVMQRRYDSGAANTYEAAIDYQKATLYQVHLVCHSMKVKASDKTGNYEQAQALIYYSDLDKYYTYAEAEALGDKHYEDFYEEFTGDYEEIMFDYWDYTEFPKTKKQTAVGKFLRGRLELIYIPFTNKEIPCTITRENTHLNGTYGLGYGWEFALPTIEAIPEKNRVMQKIVYKDFLHLTDGRSLAIKNSEFSDYKLEDIVISYRVGTISDPHTNGTISYTVLVSHKDGSKDCFQAVKNSSNQTEYYNLVAQQDKFGNTIKYNMQRNGGMTITDTWGREIKLTKSGNTLAWQLPGTQQITYTTSGNALTQFVDQCGRKTEYQYTDRTAIAQGIPSGSGDSDPVSIPFKYLTQIKHPTGATTNYTYDSAIKITTDKGSYRQYFPISQRKDIADGKIFNQVDYTFTPASVNYIQTATVKRKNGSIVETHTFNKEHLCESTEIKHGGKLVRKVTCKYGEKDTANDYKLPVEENAYLYDGNSTSNYLRKQTKWEYNDKKRNVKKETVNFYVNASGTAFDSHVSTMEYDATYSMLTKSTVQKDASTTVTQEFTLRSDKKAPSRLRVLEGSAEKERTEYSYAGSTGAVETEKRYNGSALVQSAVFSYGSYSPLPTEKKVLEVKNADGTPAINGTGVYTEASVYDACGRVIKATDGNGHSTQFTYDGLGRILTEIYDDKSEKQIFYNDSGNEITTTDENGNKKKVVYTKLGQVAQAYDLPANTLLKAFAYSNESQLQEETAYSSVGATKTTYTYDLFDRVTSKKVTGKEVSATETYSYEDLYNQRYSRESSTVAGDANSPAITSRVVKNHLGHVMEETKGNSTVKWERDKLGNPTRMIDPLNHATQIKCDYAGRVLEETDPNSATAKAVYDNLGRKTEAVNRIGGKSLYTYDALGRLLLVETLFDDNFIAKIRYTYDGAGNVIQQEQLCNVPGAAEKWRRTTYQYDVRGRLEESTAYEQSGTANSVRYQYDPAGNKTAMLTGILGGDTAGALRTVYTYDRFGNMTSLTDPAGKRETYYYDAYGMMTGKTDRAGNVTAITRDGVGRVLEEQVKNAQGKVTASTSVHYTATGAKAQEKNDILTISFAYDASGRLVKQAEGDVVKTYRYNEADCRTSFVLAKGSKTELSLTYGYDKCGRLTSVNSGGKQVAAYTYDDQGNRLTTEYSQTGITVDCDYNKANLTTSVTNKSSGRITSSYKYAYNMDGTQRTKTDHTGATTTYTYDTMGRLVQEAKSGGDTITYTYDRHQNRVGMKVDGREPYKTAYNYNKNNQLTHEVKESKDQLETLYYYYDANGNQITRERELLAPLDTAPRKAASFNEGIATLERRGYNGYNQSVWVYADGVRIAYDYRPDGLRHSKMVDGTKTTHLWDGDSIVAEAKGSGNVTARYLRGIGLIGREQDGGMQYYLHNAHSDVVQRLDSWGNLLKDYRYDAFGVEQEIELLDSNPFRYCGEYYDGETGTIYLRARYYNPRNGRFCAEDSIRDGVNWYGYCGNNPVSFVDPTGLSFDKSKTANDFQRDLFRWWLDGEAAKWKGTSNNVEVTIMHKIVKDLTGSFLWEHNGTLTFGIYGSFSAFAFSATAAPELSFDNDGNTAIQFSGSIDRTTTIIPSASAGTYVEISNLPNVLAREKSYAGVSEEISATIPGAIQHGIGVGYSNLLDEETGETFIAGKLTSFVSVSLDWFLPGLDSPYEGSTNTWSKTMTIINYNKETGVSLGNGGLYLADAINTAREIQRYNEKYGY